jgi:hypothetical protein
MEVTWHLAGKYSPRSQVSHAGWKQPFVVRKPLQSGVGKQQINGFGRLPIRNINQLPLDLGCAFPSLIEHAGRKINTNALLRMEVGFQKAGNFACSASQIDNVVWF